MLLGRVCCAGAEELLLFNGSGIMRRVYLLGSLLAVLLWGAAVLVSPAGADDKKDDPKKEKKDSDKKTDGIKIKDLQTKKVGALQGKLKGVDESSFTLQIRIPGAGQKEVEFIIAEDVKVRSTPEPEFDSKGKLKPFKPDPNDPDRKLGGVKASKDDLRDGQGVVVTYGKAKNNKIVATLVLILPENK
jgi:hypothetical protein